MDEPPPAAATLDLLLEAASLLASDTRRDLEARGLTESRTHVVWTVHHQGPRTQRELADTLQVSPRNITGLVDALEQTGFVVRRPHPHDRRASLVELTDHGREVAEALAREHAVLADQLFAGLSPRQLSTFSKGLEHVVIRLRALVSPDFSAETGDRHA